MAKSDHGNKYRRIIMYGPPNCGKGTHARYLGSVHGYRHNSTGDLFRERRSEDPEFVERYGKLMDEGGLLPDEVTLGVFLPHFKKIEPNKLWTLDGVPRTDVQLEKLMEVFKERGEDKGIITFHFSGLDEDQLWDRASKRTSDNGERRADDAQKWVFFKRMMFYYKAHDRLLAALRRHTTVVDIIASREIHEIRADILHELHLTP